MSSSSTIFGQVGACIRIAADIGDSALITEAVTALQLASGAVFLRDTQGRYRKGKSVGWPAQSAAILPFREALVHRLLRTGQPVRLREQDIHEAMPKGSAQPVLAIPILGEGELRAIVLYGAHTAGDSISNEEAPLLAKLAVAAGQAYDHVDAVSLRARIKELEASLAAQSRLAQVPSG